MATIEAPRTAAAPGEQDVSLTIAQVSEVTGFSTDTLRYYEREGLIERVGRTTGNQRRYASADLAWLEFLLRLRETGMPIADMKRFARFRAAGDESIPDRIAMLRTHADGLADHIRALQLNALALSEKITHYEQLLKTQEEEIRP